VLIILKKKIKQPHINNNTINKSTRSSSDTYMLERIKTPLKNRKTNPSPFKPPAQAVKKKVNPSRKVNNRNILKIISIYRPPSPVGRLNGPFQ
jgi:hypothetical protein